MLELKLVDRGVTKYNEETKDWSPDYFSSVYDCSVEVEDLSLEVLVDSLESILGDMVTLDDILIEDNYLMVSQIEDEQGYPDKGGKFLVDYTFIVTKTKRVSLPDYNN